MATYFFDSSALAKRYVNELGTAWVTGLLAATAGHQIYLARITGVEVIAAIRRRARSGSLTAVAAAAAILLFRQEFAVLFDMVAVSRRLVMRAMDLAEQHPLRGYDAVQLAAALRVNAQRLRQGFSPLTLVSADASLNAAARAEGLAVDDPNNHP